MVDLKQFISAIDQIAEEKGIPKEKVVETIEMALAAAYKKDYGEKGQNIRVKLEEKTGEAKFFQVMTAVDESMIFSEEEIAQMERERAEREAKMKGESEELIENTEPQPPAVETVESE
ncbi:MAG: hypothetical protein HYV66_03050, partial [Candidatus Sungbacteria bacterium]|nr:hypothetical protein [Candidatus Sungbacteria bacterium]